MLATLVDNMIRSMGIGYYILVYGIGLCAMVFSVIAVQFKKRVTIILGNFLGQSSWMLYFLLQNDLMSAIVCGLSAVMLAIFSKKDKWKWATGIVSIVVFLLLFSAVSLFTFQTWSDIFPLLVAVLGI